MASVYFNRKYHFNSARWVLLLASITLLGGCASIADPYEQEIDPAGKFNRSIYSFNDGVDKALLKPVAQGYRAATHHTIDKGVTNFFSNLDDIIVVANDILQFKFRQTGSDLSRFALNSTLGLFGIIDLATSLGFTKHNEDFGQTLGAWGVGSGPYLVLPFLGPSNLRDALASIPDLYLDPLNYIDKTSTYLGVAGLRIVDHRSDLLGASRWVDEAALDPYEFMRDSYLQRREFLIYDGNPPLDDDEYAPF